MRISKTVVGEDGFDGAREIYTAFWHIVGKTPSQIKPGGKRVDAPKSFQSTVEYVIMHVVGATKWLCIITDMHYEIPFWLVTGILDPPKVYALWRICIMTLCIMTYSTVLNFVHIISIPEHNLRNLGP